MQHQNNSVTVFNTTGKTIPAFAPVEITGTENFAGFGDDVCYSVAPATDGMTGVLGVSSWEIPDNMPGCVVVSGMAPADIAGFFSSGDRISPVGNNSWKADENGSVTVIAPSEEGKPGVVMIGNCTPSSSTKYSGPFAVTDISTPDELRIFARGGWTDIGDCSDREFLVSGSAYLYLLAQYHKASDRYSLMLTLTPEEERSSDEYTTWRIANIVVKSAPDNRKKLEIEQLWVNKDIYFSSRFWV